MIVHDSLNHVAHLDIFLHQSSVMGSPVARPFSLLCDHCNAAARARLFQSGGTPMMFHQTMTGLDADERASVLSKFDAAAKRLLDGYD